MPEVYRPEDPPEYRSDPRSDHDSAQTLLEAPLRRPRRTP